MNRRDKKESSILQVLDALKREGTERKQGEAKLKSDLDDNAALLKSIQSLHSRSSRQIDKLGYLMGTNTVVPNLRTSPLGKFISSEIKRNLNALNARELGNSGIGGRPFMGGARQPGIGSLTSNLKTLLKTMLPSFLGGVAGGAVGGVIGSSGGGGSGGGSGLGYTPGESQKYEDLSAFNDRGSRNVNPGNVKGTGYLGQVGQDEKGHAKFATKEAGVAGVVDRLYRYNQDAQPGDRNPGLAGKKTIREIMQIYAPASDGNNTEAYIASISKQLGIAPDQKIDFKQNPELLKPFVQTIMKNESPGARAYTDAEIDKGIEIGSDKALLGKDVAYEKHAAYLRPQNTPGRRAAETLVAGKSGDLNVDLFNTTREAAGTRYGYGSKSLETGAIDCSGWVQSAMQKAGAPQNVIEQLSGKNAAEQVIGTGRSNSTLQATNDVSSGGLKEGQLIGVRNNGSRMGGIGHVGIVVRNPDTGELGVSHSASSKGVTWQPIASFQRDFGKYGFLTSDPLEASRRIKKEEDTKAEEAKQASDLAANTTQAAPEVTAALTGQPVQESTDAGAQQASIPGTQVADALSEPQNGTEGVTPGANTAQEKGPSLQDYPKNSGTRLTREADYGLGDRASTNQQHRDYLASNDSTDPVSSNTNSPFFKEPEPKSELAGLNPSRNQANTGAGILGATKTRDGSLAPNVAPVNKAASIRPVAAREPAPVAQAPIIIQQAPQKKEEKGQSSSAGGSLPMRVDNLSVLAFQIDPLTPVHS